MASEVNTRRYADMAVGELLARAYIAELPKLVDVHWVLRVSQDGWMEISFDSSLTENRVERLGPSLAARVVMHAIEQSQTLQNRGIDDARKLNDEMMATLKQEIGF